MISLKVSELDGYKSSQRLQPLMYMPANMERGCNCMQGCALILSPVDPSSEQVAEKYDCIPCYVLH